MNLHLFLNCVTEILLVEGKWPSGLIPLLLTSKFTRKTFSNKGLILVGKLSTVFFFFLKNQISGRYQYYRWRLTRSVNRYLPLPLIIRYFLLSRNFKTNTYLGIVSKCQISEIKQKQNNKLTMKPLPSGFPNRFNGISWMKVCLTLSGTVLVIGVSMKPGRITLHLIPNLEKIQSIMLAHITH